MSRSDTCPGCGADYVFAAEAVNGACDGCVAEVLEYELPSEAIDKGVSLRPHLEQEADR